MASSPPDKSSPLLFAAGDWVRVQGMPGVGRVLEVDPRRRQARVLIRNHEWVVRLARLRASDPPEPPPDREPPPLINASPVYHQIDLHGERVEEAIELAERAVDQAVAGGLDRVRIIHGHGTGALRQAIRAMLARNTHVESFRFGSPYEGGLACTIAELRRVPPRR